MAVMNLLLHWSRQAHHLLVTRQEGRPELIARTLNLLVEIIRSDGASDDMEWSATEKKLAWLILVNGWDVFMTSTDRTFELLGLCLNESVTAPISATY